MSNFRSAACVMACVVLSLLGIGRFVDGREPLGVRPHYHGFHVGQRHALGWRYPSRTSYSGYRPFRSYYYQSYGWRSPYGYGVLTDARVPYGYVYPPVVYSAPPVFVPPELHFGPQALDRFLGQDRNAGLRRLGLLDPPAVAAANLAAANLAAANLAAANQAAANLAAGAGGVVDGARQANAPDVRRTVRKSNARARERAGRFLEFGNNLFAQQRYHEALQRYKSAAQAAPDLGEPYFRQAHALVATNRFEQAATSLRRALALDDDVRRGGFRMDHLYGGAKLAKDSHLDSLARQALEHPHNADVLVLLGDFLFHDGQPLRAKAFFERARVLLGDRAGYLQPYFDQIAKESADALDL